MPRPVTPIGLLAAELEALRAHVDMLEDTDPRVLVGLERAAALASGLDPYLVACTTPASLPLQALAAATAAEDWGAHDGASAGADAPPRLEPEMLSGHVEGQLLRMLVRATGARRVLELGMFTGYSALAMAEAVPTDGVVVACEVDPGVAAFAQEHFDRARGGDRIDVRVGPASDTLQTLDAEDAEPFDLVFVDADKPGYAAYVDTLLRTGLLAERGLICVDNTLMQGEPYAAAGGDVSPNGEAIAAFNRTVADDPRVEQVLLPVRDGLTLIHRS